MTRSPLWTGVLWVQFLLVVNHYDEPCLWGRFLPIRPGLRTRTTTNNKINPLIFFFFLTLGCHFPTFLLRFSTFPRPSYAYRFQVSRVFDSLPLTSMFMSFPRTPALLEGLLSRVPLSVRVVPTRTFSSHQLRTVSPGTLSDSRSCHEVQTRRVPVTGRRAQITNLRPRHLRPQVETLRVDGTVPSHLHIV